MNKLFDSDKFEGLTKEEMRQFRHQMDQNISDGESQLEKVQFLLYFPYLILFYAFILFGIERMFKMMYEANLILYSYSSSNCANIFLSVLQCGIVVSDLQVDLKHLSIQGFLSFQEHSFSIIEHFVFDYCIILKMKKTIILASVCHTKLAKRA